MKSPLATLKDKFGDKAKLVAELEKLTKDEDLWVNRITRTRALRTSRTPSSSSSRRRSPR